MALCLSSHDCGSTTMNGNLSQYEMLPLVSFKVFCLSSTLSDVNNLTSLSLDWHSPAVSEPLHFHTKYFHPCVLGWSCKHKYVD